MEYAMFGIYIFFFIPSVINKPVLIQPVFGTSLRAPIINVLVFYPELNRRTLKQLKLVQGTGLL